MSLAGDQVTVQPMSIQSVSLADNQVPVQPMSHQSVSLADDQVPVQPMSIQSVSLADDQVHPMSPTIYQLQPVSPPIIQKQSVSSAVNQEQAVGLDHAVNQVAPVNTMSCEQLPSTSGFHGIVTIPQRIKRGAGTRRRMTNVNSTSQDHIDFITNTQTKKKLAADKNVKRKNYK